MPYSYLHELNTCQTTTDIKRSNDGLENIFDSYFTLEFLDCLEKHRNIIFVQYDSKLLYGLLDNAVALGVTSSRPQLAVLNGFLDALPADNKFLLKDLEKWAEEAVRSVEFFVKKEYSGRYNANWSRCAYAVDLCDFVATCIVPRLRIKINERLSIVARLKEQIMELWYYKLLEKQQQFN